MTTDVFLYAPTGEIGAHISASTHFHAKKRFRARWLVANGRAEGEYFMVGKPGLDQGQCRPSFHSSEI